MMTSARLMVVFAGMCAVATALGIASSEAAPANLPAGSNAEGEASTASAAPGEQLDEIIVTSQRRVESLQKSSLALQVATGADLERAGVTQATDLNSVVPGLQLAMGGSKAQIYIRGVGDFSATGLGNPAVAFNMDGVYVARAENIGTNFYDVQRVEVLKGPQGTLYGRNAAGGAINLITNAPSLDDFNGNVTLEGGSYSLKHVEGAVNVPINSQFAVRAAFNVIDRNGYISDGTDDDVQRAARIRALWKPSDAVSLVLNFDGAHQGGRGPGYTLLPTPAGDGKWTSASRPAGVAAMLASQPALLPIDGTKSRQDNTYWNASAELNWDMRFATLTVQPAFRHADIDYSSDPGIIFSENGRSDEMTVEARLAKDNGWLNWVAGLYYYSEAQRSEELDPASLFIPGFDNDQPEYPHTQSAAAFGQATFSLTSSFRLIAGLRYTNEHRSLTGESIDLRPSFVTGAPSPAVAEVFSGTHTWNSVTWKGGLEYDLAPESMLYLTAATGFKAGGLNQTVAPLDSFAPEKLLAYELGIRNRFLDRRLQVNLQLFKWDYKDPQESKVIIDPDHLLNFLTLNAGRARIAGADVDVQASLTKADTIHATTEYVSSRYSSSTITLPFSVFGAQVFSPASNGCPTSAPLGNPATIQFIQLNCAGFQVARSPLWSGSLNYQHRFALGNGGQIIPSYSAQFASARWLAVDFTPSERAPAYVVSNIDISFVSPKAHWQLTGYVHNIADRAVYTGGIERAFAQSLFYATILPPRIAGLRAEYQF